MLHVKFPINVFYNNHVFKPNFFSTFFTTLLARLILWPTHPPQKGIEFVNDVHFITLTAMILDLCHVCCMNDDMYKWILEGRLTRSSEWGKEG